MNWLAHIFLSDNSIDYQLGNVLADPFKGRIWEGAPDNYRQGVNMHKRIDVFTDAHAVVSKSKSRLGKKGYLKGVIVDITYDYLLSKHWDTYASVSLACFLDDFYAQAKDAQGLYPDKESEFIRRLVVSDYLKSYGDVDGLSNAFKRIDDRLSDNILKKESASGYLYIVEDQLVNLESDFITFFPDLIAHVQLTSNNASFSHWR